MIMAMNVQFDKLHCLFPHRIALNYVHNQLQTQWRWQCSACFRDKHNRFRIIHEVLFAPQLDFQKWIIASAEFKLSNGPLPDSQ